MELSFTVHQADAATTIRADIQRCIIAGWAGRDMAAIEHHIEELAELGVPRPSAIPLFYRVAANQLTQAAVVQCIGENSSGEAEVFLFSHQGRMLVSLASDHTDRKLEAHSVALSKQLCVKPVATDSWRYDDVVGHWDQLMLRSWIVENGAEVLYQEGPLASLQPPAVLLSKHFGSDHIPEGVGMTCGTVGAIGGIRSAMQFRMELHDPVLDRSIGHAYTLDILPEIA